MKTSVLRTLALMSAIVMFILSPITAHGIAEWDGEYFAHGAGLSESQLKETERLLGIEGREIEDVLVDQAVYKEYTGLTTRDSSLYSSVVVIKTAKGSGVNVYINSPDNITKIKDHQYVNAAITSGVYDSDIIVASPVKVSGESALIGIYKALDNAGVEVNDEAVRVANDELSMVKEITENNDESGDFDAEELTIAIAEMKEEISKAKDKDSLSDNDVREIIDNALEKRSIVLSESDKANIASWIQKFKGLDIDWNGIGNQLKNIGNTIADKTGKLYEWEQENGFFSNLWESIKSFFKNLFSSSTQTD